MISDQILAQVRGSANGKLAFVLRFSNRLTPDGLTVTPHCKIIEAHKEMGCWWGWWKADHKFDDDSVDLLEALPDKPMWVGLWNRSGSQAYVALCAEIRTRNGQDIEAPDGGYLTPAYYNKESFPAWFRFTQIYRVDGSLPDPRSELNEGDLSEPAALESIFRPFVGELSDTTIFWPTEGVASAFSRPAIQALDRSAVLHISDTHFGKFHEWQSESTNTISKMTVMQALEVAFDRQSLDPHRVGVIVVSGDLISGEKDVEDQRRTFREAELFLRQVFDWTGTTSSNLVIVPGNHDVTRSEIDLDSEEPYDHTKKQESSQESDRRKRGETAYREFVERLMGGPTEITSLRRFNMKHNYALNFVQMNSTLPRDSYTKEFGHIGEYPTQVLMKMRELQKTQLQKDQTPVNFGVLHHHVISTVDDEYVPKPKRDDEHVDPVSMTLDASNLIDWAADYELRFLLHGHQHKEKWRFVGNRQGQASPFSTEIIGAGSLGAKWRPKDTPHSFNLYEFEAEGSVHGRAISLGAMGKDIRVLNDVRVPAGGRAL